MSFRRTICDAGHLIGMLHQRASDIDLDTTIAEVEGLCVQHLGSIRAAVASSDKSVFPCESKQ